MSDDDRKTVSASALFFAPADRIEKLVNDLIEWSSEERLDLHVLRVGSDQVMASKTYKTNTNGLANGTLSAAAWLATDLDRALSDLSDYRWWGPVKVTASLLDRRDEVVDADDPQDDADMEDRGDGWSYGGVTP